LGWKGEEERENEEVLMWVGDLIDPLLMNAFNNVNLAGACILTSVEYAMEMGIPEEKWVYPLGGAGTSDSEKCKVVHIPNSLWNLLTELKFGRDRISILVPRFLSLWMRDWKSLGWRKGMLILLIFIAVFQSYRSWRVDILGFRLQGMRSLSHCLGG
jgi:hypothetical protein